MSCKISDIEIKFIDNNNSSNISDNLYCFFVPLH